MAPVVALVLSAMMPVTLAVVAVAVFGVAHLALETRYVVGRVSLRLDWPVLALLIPPLTVIAVLRLEQQGRIGSQAEAAIALGLVAAAWGWCLWGRWPAWVLGLAAVAGLTGAAWHRPDLYIVAVVHLHNLTPVAFLWEWSRDRGTRAGRTLFRLAQIGWAVVVPVLLLVGVADGRALEPLRWTGDRTAAQITHTYSPAGWSDPWATRFLMVFCFGQLMHYVIWCGFLPKVASDDHQRAATVGPAGRVFRPRLFVSLAAAVALTLGVLQLASGHTGRRWYSAIASYHAYFEYPVLVVFLAAMCGASVTHPRRSP